MKLVSFAVRNFRSIKATAKLKFSDGLTTLIGPNNEGKSNILRALVAALEVASRLDEYTLLKGGRLRAMHPGERIYRWETDFPLALQPTAAASARSEFDLEFELTTDEVSAFRTEVQSSLNGTLPIRIALGRDEPVFSVRKRGRGSKSLSEKRSRIARFIGRRIDLQYIPAVRPAAAATSVVEQIVALELARLRNNTEYAQAVAKVEAIQQPVLETIGVAIRDTLRVFLPEVKDVTVSIPPDVRYRTYARSVEVLVDDGQPTVLSSKGDGVQSLAALGMMRYAAQQQGREKQLVLAIEEPESHLHPRAIHELKNVLQELAKQHQVIITTHCPLFVERRDPAANIVVAENTAQPAPSISHIRDAMGIRLSDNLTHAEVMLIVEGEDDRRVLQSLLGQFSPSLGKALASGALGIDVLNGSSNLAYKLTLAREAMCVCHVFVDNDRAAHDAVKHAVSSRVLDVRDLTHANCPGMSQSELEDFYDASIIARPIANTFGIDTSHKLMTATSKKWSERMRELFLLSGKSWNDFMLMQLKRLTAETVAESPATAIHSSRKPVLNALVRSLELKVGAGGGRDEEIVVPAIFDNAPVAQERRRREKKGNSEAAGRVLNDKEQAVLNLLRSRGAALGLQDVGTATFPNESATRANSWARNSMRKLVEMKLVAKVSRGTYVAC